MGDFDRQRRVRRLTAIGLCLVMVLGIVLPSHALAAEPDRAAAPAEGVSAGAGHDHGHDHRSGAGGPEVAGHCSATGCFSALPSAEAGLPGPDLSPAGRVSDQPPHLSPALQRDPPVPRLA